MSRQLPDTSPAQRHFSEWILGLLTLLAPIALEGCGSAQGPARLPVGGTILFDNTPLRSGTIRFIPTRKTKGPAAVATVKDGIYKLNTSDGPIAGTHRIEIEATNLQSFPIDDEQAYALQSAQGGAPIPLNPIPPIYNRQSTLQKELPDEGNMQLDFQLTSKP